MCRPSIRIAARAAFALSVTAYGTLAHAQHLNDRWWLSVAGFRPTIESTARSDFLPGNRPGTEIRFEDDLGLSDRKTLPWILAGARLGERWRVELEYFSLRRSGTRTLSRDIEWGDSTYPASATLSSEFDSDVLRLSAGYSFVRSSSTEIGGVLGLHTTRFRLALASQVSVGNAAGSGQAEAEEATVPLPTVGLYGTHRFDSDWSVAGRIDYFSFSSGDYQGGLVNLMAGVEYRFTDRVGVALGYRYVDYSLDIDRPQWRGGVDYRFRGPYLSLQLGL